MLRASLPLLALLSLVTAQQLPAGAPACVGTCLQAKLQEAGTLVPGVSATDVASLCASSTFTAAFDTCLKDNCNAADLSTGQTLLAQVCAASTTSASIAASAQSTADSLALESSASSVLETASSRAESILSTAATATSSGALSSASAFLSSSLESVASSLDSDVSSRAASITSSASSAIQSAVNITSVSAAASGTTGASPSGDGGNAAPHSVCFSAALFGGAALLGWAALA